MSVPIIKVPYFSGHLIGTMTKCVGYDSTSIIRWSDKVLIADTLGTGKHITVYTCTSNSLFLLLYNL